MARTIFILGSDEVMASFAEPGTFYRGKWQDINIIGVSKDKETPLDIRKSLVGLTIPTIFSKEQLESQRVKLPIPGNSRLAYVHDVIDTLNTAGKYNEARQLQEIVPDFFDMYSIEEEIYDLA